MGSARQRRARRRGDIQLARRAIRRGVCPCREPRILEHRLPHLAGCRWGIFRWTVALCVNDGHTGAFTGRLSALEIRNFIMFTIVGAILLVASFAMLLVVNLLQAWSARR